MNKKNYLIIGAVVVILLIAFVVKKNPVVDENINSSLVSTSTDSGVVTLPTKIGEKIVGQGYTIEAVPLATNYPKPNLDTPTVFPKTIDANAIPVLEKNLATIIQKLKANPGDYQSWLLYGIYKKTAEDYKGAEAAWLYATTMPHNYIVFGNLGDLYAYNLHNNVKAEQNLKMAISLAKDNPMLYANLYYFYRDVLNDKSKAKAIAEQGMKAVPGAKADLQKLIDQL